MKQKITGYSLESYNGLGYPTSGKPAETQFTVVIDNSEAVTVVFPLNPTIEEFEKIALNFLRRVRHGNINQRKFDD